MTDRKATRRRLPKWALRAFAWVAGALAFASPFAALTASPKPASAEGTAPRKERRVIVVRMITRRVIVHPAPETQGVRYVYVGGGSSSGSSGGSSGGGGAVAAPPPTSTGGS